MTYEELWDRLDRYGVVVVKNLFDRHTTLRWRDGMIDWLKNLNTGLSNDPSTWDPVHMPHGPRKGMMQSLISNCPTMWEMRTEFLKLYGKLWNMEAEDLVTSLDGASILPPVPKLEGKDWPHVDMVSQIDRIVDPSGGIQVQGQIVLNDSNGGFVCSPCSHLLHKEVVSMARSRSDFFKLDDGEQEVVRQKLAAINGAWQTLISAPAGSVILWRSSTIHSGRPSVRTAPGAAATTAAAAAATAAAAAATAAAGNNDDDDVDDEDKAAALRYRNWRMAAYICMRPRFEHNKNALAALRQAAMEGRMTNHSGSKIFPLSGKLSSGEARDAQLESLLANPSRTVDAALMQRPDIVVMTGGPKA